MIIFILDPRVIQNPTRCSKRAPPSPNWIWPPLATEPAENMINDKAASTYGIEYPGLAAIVDNTYKGTTEVSTTLECLVKNSVKAYRKSLKEDENNEKVRLKSLVVSGPHVHGLQGKRWDLRVRGLRYEDAGRKGQESDNEACCK